ncbi:MAG: A/G-specific adenine glycosylase [Alphaproteobacteria bacterium]|nr:A/G-specific adenine glycosylase [Alphaproteobacteria bacterium]
MTSSSTVSSSITPRHQAATTALLDWYDVHRRDLPWRARHGQRPNPYHVWLSEIMLQQTTVATVKSYFARFTERWPEVADLAAADRDEVMSAWAGLGYYARARNLHAAAKRVANDHGGAFPADEDGLRQLPGVGPYTAAAIAAIAFGQRAVVVDGNIERVTARWDAVTTPLPTARPELYRIMDALTPRGEQGSRAGDFAQAMMDLGSGLCTPPRKTKNGLSQPSCMICPLMGTCAASGKAPENFPVKKAKTPRPDRHGVALVIEDQGGHIALERRRDDGMLGGLYVFPGSGWADGSPKVADYPMTSDCGGGIMLDQFGHGETLNTRVEHIFSHFRVILTIQRLRIEAKKPPLPDGLHWVDRGELAAKALPTVMVKVARAAGLIDPRD